MNGLELLNIISNGETSKVQFKREINDNKSIAAEMIAFSNSRGGTIFFGIEDKTRNITGLSNDKIGEYSQRLGSIANDFIKPQVFIYTDVIEVSTEDVIKKILIVEVLEGTAKPYKDNDGTIWVKQGADKRKLTDNAEIMRLFQQSGLIYLDEMILRQTSIDDIEFLKVKHYIKIVKKQESNVEIDITEQVLQNLNIIQEGSLTLGGLLFFAKEPQKYRPAFCVKAVSFFGTSIGGTDYRSSQDIHGTIPEVFQETIRFLKTNLLHIQADQNFNSVGKLEVSEIALEELIQNALVHRDYSKNAPIRLMIFDDRIEIISPGSLPNSLTIENIKMGNAVIRNNLLVSYCSKVMNYRGFGSGITRALEHQPNIEFINDIEGEQFKVIIPRIGRG